MLCALAKPLVQSRAVGLFATFSNSNYTFYHFKRKATIGIHFLPLSEDII